MGLGPTKIYSIRGCARHLLAPIFFALLGSQAAFARTPGKLCDIILDAVGTHGAPLPQTPIVQAHEILLHGSKVPETEIGQIAHDVERIFNADMPNTTTLSTTKKLAERPLFHRPHAVWSSIFPEVDPGIRWSWFKDVGSKLYHAVRKKVVPKIGKITKEDDLLIQRLEVETDVAKIISHRAKGKSPSQTTKEQRPMLDVLNKLRDGTALTRADIDTMALLRNRIMSFENNRKTFEKKMNLDGEVDTIIANHLQDNDHYLRKKIGSLRTDESYVMSVPRAELQSDGTYKLSAKIEVFNSLAEYDTYFNSMVAQASSYGLLKKQYREYTEDYLFARYIARRIPWVVEDRRVGHARDHQDYRLPEPVFSFKPHSPSSIEAENKALYGAIADDMKVLFDRDTEIHPSPEYLAHVSSRLNAMGRLARASLGTTTVAGTLAGAWKLSTEFLPNLLGQKEKITKNADLLEQQSDEFHAMDSAYWIEKCKAKETTELKDKCLHRFGDVLAKKLDDKIIEGRKHDPSFDSAAVYTSSDWLVSTVINGTYPELSKPYKVTFAIFNPIRQAKVSVYEEAMDAVHALDNNYWVKKCSQKTSVEEVDRCFNDFKNTLTAELQQQADDKLAKDSNYVDIPERVTADRIIIDVINRTYAKLPLKLYIDLTAMYAMRYGKESVYNTAKLSVAEVEKKAAEEAKQKKEEKQKTDAHNSDTLATTGTSPAPTPPRVTSAADIQKQIEEISAALNNAEVNGKIMLDAQKDPKSVAKLRADRNKFLIRTLVELEGIPLPALTPKLRNQVADLKRKVEAQIKVEEDYVIGLAPAAKELDEKKEDAPAAKKEEAKPGENASVTPKPNANAPARAPASVTPSRETAQNPTKPKYK
ncbi:MAG TPA: hypothetical protein VM901_00190 [Bdellovibrionota bacterium]|jgi:hypothetical protein|nr:hypothetical protein [Bdellovibrionota bacterium]